MESNTLLLDINVDIIIEIVIYMNKLYFVLLWAEYYGNNM